MSSTNNTTVNNTVNNTVNTVNTDKKEQEKRLLPDSPRTKSRKYQEYVDKEDYHGASEYLQDQQYKKYDTMTPEELNEHFENIADLDDDYTWSSFA